MSKKGGVILKKSWFFRLIYSFVIVVLATGCSNQSPDKNESDITNSDHDNPFEVNDEDTGVMSAIGHGIVNPEMDESGEKRAPIHYNGGELEIDYFVNASGKAKNVGFLVFVDGIPQPYKLNMTESAYEYMHIFDLEEDDKDTPFTFRFTPVTGKQGDTLDLAIASVYNPAFRPDMKETSSYGGYHTTLQAIYSLYFERNADTLGSSDIPENDYLNKVDLSTEPITDELLERHSGMVEVDLEALETRVLSEVYFDGDYNVWKDGNLQVNDNGTLSVTFKIFGHPGVRYQNTFYSNHQALTTKDGKTSFETVLEKGEVAVVDVEIDLERLEDFNTFYVVSTPMNSADFPEDVLDLIKTDSILLYK